jgi:hypothetical protein
MRSMAITIRIYLKTRSVGPRAVRVAGGREAFDEAMQLQSIAEEEGQSTPASQPAKARMGF